MGREHLRDLDPARDARRGRPAAELADALAFLGDVHELEVRAERPRDPLGAVRRHPVDDPFAASTGRRARALAERDAREPEPLHVGEQLGPAVAPDRIAEDRRQEPDVPTQLVGDRPPPAASFGGRARRHGPIP
jgi:hypothetical protein